MILRFFFFKQKTAYEMRISDWSSDVCSSDLLADEVSLHVEYELPAAEAIERRVRIDRRDLVQLKEAAGPPGSGVRSVEGEQRAGGAAGGDHAGAAAEPAAPRVLARPLLGQTVYAPSSEDRLAGEGWRRQGK